MNVSVPLANHGSLLNRLVSDTALEIIHIWLNIENLTLLDSACCNHRERPLLLSNFGSEYFIHEYSFPEQCGPLPRNTHHLEIFGTYEKAKINFFNWIFLRNIHLNPFNKEFSGFALLWSRPIPYYFEKLEYISCWNNELTNEQIKKKLLNCVDIRLLSICSQFQLDIAHKYCKNAEAIYLSLCEQAQLIQSDISAGVKSFLKFNQKVTKIEILNGFHLNGNILLNLIATRAMCKIVLRGITMPSVDLIATMVLKPNNGNITH